MRILRARLLAGRPGGGRRRGQPRPARSQVRTVDRSERIRTYNFPENRISDHRTGYKAYNLDQVLDGDLQPVLDSCVEADLAARLEALEPVSGRARRAAASAAARGSRRRASPAPSTTPPSCSRTCSAPPAAGSPLVEDVPADAAATAYDGLVARRAAREPLQHLTGIGRLPARGARGRTRGLRAPARDRAARRLGGRAGAARAGREPVVVDLCTGSGAIARRSPTRCRRPAVHAVELDEARARVGASATSPAPASTCGWATWPTAFDDLAGTVDVVVCNPPYIPLEAWESVAAEARDHDPHLALFSGADGLDAIRVLERRAARAAAARGRGRRRARRRPGRVRAGGLRGHRALARGARPPRPGRPSALHDGRGWHDERRHERSAARPSTDERARGPAIEAAALAVQRGRLVVLPTDTVYGVGADAFDPDAVQRPARGQGPRPRDAAAGAGQRGHHRSTRWPSALPGYARALVEEFWPGPLTLVCHQQPSPAVGPRRHPRHRRGPDARPRRRPASCSSAPARWRSARPTCTGQPGRHRRRRRPRRCSGDARRGDHRRRAARRAAEAVDDRRRHRRAGPGAAPRRARARASSTRCSSRSAPRSIDEG